MAWRFYARRFATGVWLDTDVPLRAEVTTELNGPGSIVGTLPTTYDVTAADGHPVWWERGTTLYCDDGAGLAAVGLLSFTRPTVDGRVLELGGLSTAYDLIAFEGRLRAWDANPYGLVEDLLADAHSQPDGDPGFRVVRVGRPGDMAGDVRPPDAPEKPKRNRGETTTHYAGRVDAWEKRRQEWEKEYGDRQPYSLGWWEQQYVGTEIAELADECRFDVTARHQWTDRDALEARHDLVLSPRKPRRRADLALVEGENMYGVEPPETSLDSYGNNVVALGAGEGRKMHRGQYSRADGRARTTRFVEAKAVRSDKRLRQKAREKYATAEVVTRLREAKVPDTLAAQVTLGDELEVRSPGFTGWQKVVAVVRDTGGDPATLRFAGE